MQPEVVRQHVAPAAGLTGRIHVFRVDQSSNAELNRLQVEAGPFGKRLRVVARSSRSLHLTQRVQDQHLTRNPHRFRHAPSLPCSIRVSARFSGSEAIRPSRRIYRCGLMPEHDPETIRIGREHIARIRTQLGARDPVKSGGGRAVSAYEVPEPKDDELTVDRIQVEMATAEERTAATGIESGAAGVDDTTR